MDRNDGAPDVACSAELGRGVGEAADDILARIFDRSEYDALWEDTPAKYREEIRQAVAHELTKAAVLTYAIARACAEGTRISPRASDEYRDGWNDACTEIACRIEEYERAAEAAA